MIPGTTPTHTFNLPISADDIAAIRITYETNGKIVLQKETDDVTLKGNEAVVKLSQGDTLQFGSNISVRIQLKIRTKGGDVLVSKMIKKTTGIVLDKGEI